MSLKQINLIDSSRSLTKFKCHIFDIILYIRIFVMLALQKNRSCDGHHSC